ncbi:Decaprenyl diphosphate synthase-like protein [Gongronella butleri]|nr:Decaprenyl diphosphate synthase-like protein [Gongronella butleri]
MGLASRYSTQGHAQHHPFVEAVVHGGSVTLLYLVHILYLVYLAGRSVQTTLWQRWQQFQLPMDLDSDKQRLKKVPAHLCIVVSSELHRSDSDWHAIIHDLCQVACWAWHMGIETLTLFDASGKLKSLAIPIYKQHDLMLHDWCHIHGLQVPSQDDFLLTIASLDDAHNDLVHAARHAHQHLVSNQLSTNAIDQTLVNALIPGTDPDLMIVYDGLPHDFLYINGYSPWHLKNTEFINATHYHRFDYALFSHCLYKYAKVEQRFGR